jgi:biotin transport system substrate-specific component
MLVLITLILTPKEAVVAVGGYLLLGTVGLPVFAGFKGGIGVLFGPTGGFLVGFLAAVLINMAFCSVFGRRVRNVRHSLALDIGSIAILILTSYSLGCLWFAVSTGSTFALALTYCVIPFVLPDIIKAAAAFSCAQPIRMALGRAPWLSARSNPSSTSSSKADL